MAFWLTCGLPLMTVSLRPACRTKGYGGKPQTADDTCGAQRIEPVGGKPIPEFHAAILPQNQIRSGMSPLAFTRRLCGRRTIGSSGPQPAVGGSNGLAALVMSMPMMAKSPFSSSQMSGHPSHATLFAPLACGSGPSRFKGSTHSMVRFWIDPGLPGRGKSVACLDSDALNIRVRCIM